MAIYDYLANIPETAFIKADLKSIDEWKTNYNGGACSNTMFHSRIPFIQDARYKSVYLGSPSYSSPYDPACHAEFWWNGQDGSGSIPPVPSGYIGRGQGFGGLPMRQVFGSNPSYVYDKYYDLANKKLAAYLEIVPVSDSRIQAGRSGKWARCSFIAGGTITAHNQSEGFAKCFSAGGWYPQMYKGSDGLFRYKEDSTILTDMFTIASIKLYAVDKSTGERTLIEGFSPVYAAITRGKYFSGEVPYNVLSVVNTSSLLVEGWDCVMQMVIPGTSSGSGILFAGARALGNINNNTQFGNTAGIRNPSANFFNFLGSYISLNAGVGNITYTVDSDNPSYFIADISGLSTVSSAYDIEAIASISNSSDDVYLTMSGYYTAMNFKRGDVYYGGNPSECIIATSTPQTFIDLYKDFGIYASDNLSEILYGEIPDLVPDNPAGGNSGVDPDLPSNGVGNTIPSNIPTDNTNAIDDFTIDIPDISPASLASGYVYNVAQVRELFNWFCSKGYIENQSELFADKLSAIYGLILYPFDFTRHDIAHLEATDVTTIVSVSENISGYKLLAGYNTIVHGGDLVYNAYYGNFADWQLCKYSIYLPYGGIVDVPPSAVVNRRLSIDYAIDLLTGKATAIIKSYSLKSDILGVLVKLVPCQIGHLVPVQSSNFAQREISNTLSSISMISTAVNGATGMLANGLAGNGLGVATSAIRMGESLINQAVNREFSQQLSYAATGSLSPSTGLALPQTPYLSIARTRLTTPSNFQMQNGIPTAYYATLSSVSTGDNFVKCDNVYLDTIRATLEEIDEIRTLLSSGVYI